MRMGRLVAAAVLMIMIQSCQRTEMTGFKGPWFGQTPPGEEPMVFGKGVFNPDYNDFNPVFSPNGKEFYFTRLGEERYTIMKMRRIGNRWTKPETVSFSGTYSDCDMFVGHDGNRMYYSTTRPLPGTDTPPEALFIWYVDRKGGDWGEPVFVKGPLNEANRSCYPTLTLSGTLYFQSDREDNIGSHDIFRAEPVNESYTVVENLGAPVNSEHPEMDVTISPDESYLIVSCKRPGGLGGSDLFIAFREDDGTWSQMLNMGKPVNSENGEGCPMITHDGKFLFFISNRSGHDENYWVSTKVIESLRPVGM